MFIHNATPGGAVQITEATPNVRRTAWSRVLQQALYWVDRHRQRRALAGLDAHLLDDIGVSEKDAAIEAAKPFWR
ncbi:MAG: DUF1127 domain-containing protein [Rhodospirillales bacterium]|nr:DUF1127 domain-containing protein [Rhodospirillales bacterium]MBO6788307.1 DUF1127 domain-containing protein [Rhodospirillales bacterium]